MRSAAQKKVGDCSLVRREAKAGLVGLGLLARQRLIRISHACSFGLVGGGRRGGARLRRSGAKEIIV